jgi:hypothetical protein
MSLREAAVGAFKRGKEDACIGSAREKGAAELRSAGQPGAAVPTRCPHTRFSRIAPSEILNFGQLADDPAIGSRRHEHGIAMHAVIFKNHLAVG